MKTSVVVSIAIIIAAIGAVAFIMTNSDDSGWKDSIDEDLSSVFLREGSYIEYIENGTGYKYRVKEINKDDLTIECLCNDIRDKTVSMSKSEFLNEMSAKKQFDHFFTDRNVVYDYEIKAKHVGEKNNGSVNVAIYEGTAKCMDDSWRIHFEIDSRGVIWAYSFSMDETSYDSILNTNIHFPIKDDSAFKWDSPIKFDISSVDIKIGDYIEYDDKYVIKSINEDGSLLVSKNDIDLIPMSKENYLNLLTAKSQLDLYLHGLKYKASIDFRGKELYGDTTGDDYSGIDFYVYVYEGTVDIETFGSHNVYFVTNSYNELYAWTITGPFFNRTYEGYSTFDTPLDV